MNALTVALVTALGVVAVIVLASMADSKVKPYLRRASRRGLLLICGLVFAILLLSIWLPLDPPWRESNMALDSVEVLVSMENHTSDHITVSNRFKYRLWASNPLGLPLLK